MSIRHLAELIQVVLDGSASDGDCEELQQILKTDREARKLYWEYAGLHQALEYRFARSSSIPARQEAMVRIHLVRQRRQLLVRSFAVAVAAMVMLGLGMWAYLVPMRKPTAVIRLSAQSIHSITRTSGDNHDENGLGNGAEVKLQQGTVELVFAGGSRATIQGPADFRVVSSTSLKLRRGCAWFDIANGDHGFTVATRDLEVVDLGTEFGVISDPIGQDEVHVFKGKVRAQSLRRQKTSEELTVGTSRQVDPIGQLKPIASRPEAFLKKLPDGLAYLHLPFDELKSGHFEMKGSFPGGSGIIPRLVPGGGSPQLVPGVAGNALSLSGKGDHVMTDWPGFSGIAPRTVSFWLKIDRSVNLSMLPNIVGWGDYRAPGGKWKSMLEQKSPGAAAFPRISFSEYAYDAPVPVNDGKWHHLAMTYSGRIGENGHPEVGIYVDGINQPLTYRDFFADPDEQRLPKTRTNIGAMPLGIGSIIDESPGTFTGLIDELKIHAGVLSAEDIQRELNDVGPFNR